MTWSIASIFKRPSSAVATLQSPKRAAATAKERFMTTSSHGELQRMCHRPGANQMANKEIRRSGGQKRRVLALVLDGGAGNHRTIGGRTKSISDLLIS
jgi:hypothetical protein